MEIQQKLENCKVLLQQSRCFHLSTGFMVINLTYLRHLMGQQKRNADCEYIISEACLQNIPDTKNHRMSG
jgi:hypothetical protein